MVNVLTFGNQSLNSFERLASVMKKLLGIVFASTILLSTVAAVAPATAGGTRPSWCDWSRTRSACAVIHNETQGFAPNSAQVSTKYGLYIKYADWQDPSGAAACYSCEMTHEKEAVPQGSGGAMMQNTAHLSSGAAAELQFGIKASANGDAFANLPIYVDSPLSSGNASDCQNYNATYVRCMTESVPQFGSSADPWWEYTVYDRPFEIRVLNYVESEAKLVGAFDISNAHALPGGLHTLQSSIPAAAESEPGSSTETGLLSMKCLATSGTTCTSQVETKVNATYQFTSGKEKGKQFQIILTIPQKGAGTGTCDISGTSAGFDCKVSTIDGNPTGLTKVTVTVQ